MKLKRPKLPTCPSLVEIRGKFREANKALRESRSKYWLACWQRGEHLLGEALLRFVMRAGKAMKANGLYSSSYPDAFVAHAGLRFFYNQETNTNDFWAFSRWRHKKNVDDWRGMLRRIAA